MGLTMEDSLPSAYCLVNLIVFIYQLGMHYCCHKV